MRGPFDEWRLKRCCPIVSTPEMGKYAVRFTGQIRLLIGFMLAAAVMPVRADIPAEPITIATSFECVGLLPDEARRLAVEASREGAHRRAAECYRAAGDLVQADRAQIRATADSSATAVQKVATTVEAAKQNARRVRAAFRKDRA